MTRYSIAAIVAFSLCSTAVADAAGICFQGGGDTLAVVKKYSKPSKGSCKNFAGWESFIPGGETVDGTACLNSSGTVLRVGYTVSAYGLPYSVRMVIPYPSLTGGTATVQYHGAGSSAFVSVASAFGLCFDLFQPTPW